jgi:protein-S-isoprenylcysteine O-methyltransferase Ste14
MASRRLSIIVSLLFTAFGGPGIILVLIPYLITGFRMPAGEPRAQIILSGTLIFAGLIPLLESIRRFIFVGRGTLMPGVPTEQLVVSGLYRYVRNPMYLGVLIALIGEALLFWSMGMAVYIPLEWLGVDLFVRRYEEPTLIRRHPDDYPRYTRHVRRWRPRLTPWEAPED